MSTGDKTMNKSTSNPPVGHHPPTDTSPQPGLDADRHARMQQVSYQADMLREVVYASYMATALGITKQIEVSAYKLYLDRLIEDAGNPKDPVERMLLEQLALAHFRVAQLHSSAGSAKNVEIEKLYSNAAARLLGELRRTALALRVYRAHVPDDTTKGKPKIIKFAQ